MDAVRISDGQIITIKVIHKRFTPFEESIIRLFSQEPLASDPHNYTIPLYETLHPPWDESITMIVMPYMIRINKHRFATIGEALECFRQLFEVSLFRVLTSEPRERADSRRECNLCTVTSSHTGEPDMYCRYVGSLLLTLKARI